ncbi:MAG: hypothetical protein P8184_15740 [Calditrichia bacterium]
MKYHIGIISEEEDPVIDEVTVQLENTSLNHYSVISERTQMQEFLSEYDCSFFIICLSADNFKKWQPVFSDSLEKYFTVIYYPSFIIKNPDEWKHIRTDFLIAGEERYKDLGKLLQFLKENHWRKIPDSLFNFTNGKYSNLMREILFTIEFSNDKNFTLDKLAIKLNSTHNEIRKEIKRIANLNFKEFKARISAYYNKVEAPENVNRQ